MRRITEIDEIKAYVQEKRKGGCSIGFVPTMGALHSGHLSLVRSSSEQNSVTIVSIFVNPTQFNNADDLKKYPRTIEADLKLLSSTACDVVFFPEVDTIYSKDFLPEKVELGFLGRTMEGIHRPGHFDGVVTVVQRLFSIVSPDNAYFGRKDFQQVAVIRQMVKTLKFSVNIIEIPTLREKSGLAMSSRNLLLNEQEKDEATIIFKILKKMVREANHHTPSEVKALAEKNFETSTLQLEYLEIVDPSTLESLDSRWVSGATACIVAYCGKVRLIDNLEIVPIAR